MTRQNINAIAFVEQEIEVQKQTNPHGDPMIWYIARALARFSRPLNKGEIMQAIQERWPRRIAKCASPLDDWPVKCSSAKNNISNILSRSRAFKKDKRGYWLLTGRPLTLERREPKPRRKHICQYASSATRRAERFSDKDSFSELKRAEQAYEHHLDSLGAFPTMNENEFMTYLGFDPLIGTSPISTTSANSDWMDALLTMPDPGPLALSAAGPSNVFTPYPQSISTVLSTAPINLPLDPRLGQSSETSVYPPVQWRSHNGSSGQWPVHTEASVSQPEAPFQVPGPPSNPEMPWTTSTPNGNIHTAYQENQDRYDAYFVPDITASGDSHLHEPNLALMPQTRINQNFDPNHFMHDPPSRLVVRSG